MRIVKTRNIDAVPLALRSALRRKIAKLAAGHGQPPSKKICITCELNLTCGSSWIIYWEEDAGRLPVPGTAKFSCG